MVWSTAYYPVTYCQGLHSVCMGGCYYPYICYLCYLLSSAIWGPRARPPPPSHSCPCCFLDSAAPGCHCRLSPLLLPLPLLFSPAGPPAAGTMPPNYLRPHTDKRDQTPLLQADADTAGSSDSSRLLL